MKITQALRFPQASSCFQLPAFNPPCVAPLYLFPKDFLLGSGSNSRARSSFSLPSPTTTRWPLSVPTTAACTPADPPSTDGVAPQLVEVDLSLELKKLAVEIAPILKGTSIFLIGMNSSIKSQVGKLLSDALRYCYFDSDSLVEEAAGGRLAALSYVQTNEAGYHEMETEVLRQLCSMGRLVVTAGNGAIKYATNLKLLRDGVSVCIDVPLDLVAREVVEQKTQLPVHEMSISGSYSEVFSQLHRLSQDLQSGYVTADTTVCIRRVASDWGYDDFAAVTPEHICLEVLKAIEKLVRVKRMMEAAARPF